MGVEMITDHRGEVRVETGIGTIVKAEPKGDRNVHLTIRAEHLREDLKCWTDKQGPMWPRVEWALAHPAHRLWYRVDVHRQRGVPIGLAYSELANRQKLRDLVDLCRPEDAPVSVTSAPPAAAQPPAKAAPAKAAPAKAAPAKAAPPAAAPPAAADPPPVVAPGALDKVLAELVRAMRTGAPPEVQRFLIETAEDLGATANQINAAGDAARPRQPADPAPAEPAGNLPQEALNGARDPDRLRERRTNPPVDEPPGAEQPPATAPAAPAGPRVSPTSGLRSRPQPIATDARPWDITNSDGRLNLASYAAGAVLEMVKLAGQLLISRARARAAEDPSYELAAPTRKQLFGLASQLIGCADVIQVRMRDGGRVDRMSASHKVARQAVREGLDLYPVPWGAPAEEREAWRTGITEYGLALTSVLLDILENRQAPTDPVPAAAAGVGAAPPADHA